MFGLEMQVMGVFFAAAVLGQVGLWKLVQLLKALMRLPARSKVYLLFSCSCHMQK